jgi:HEAT repeat protein
MNIGSRTARADCRSVPPSAGTAPFDDKLIAALVHERPDVAAISAEILGRRRVRRAVGPLIAALGQWRDADEVSMAIIRALAELGDEAAIVPLSDVLRHRPLRQRISAAQALGQFTHPAARHALQQAALHDPNQGVRRAAADALARSSSSNEGQNHGQ